MSFIQKILEEAVERRSVEQKTDLGFANKAAKELPAVTEIFKSLLTAATGSQVMEINKILPALEDRNAIAAYKILRTRVLQRMRSNDWRTLIVTSAGPGEGKTMTACNLAVSISNDVNQSVVLVDLDLQRPSMASYFGLKVEASIGDYLTGNAELEDIMYAPEGMDRIVIIPNRDQVKNSSELLASPRMRILVDSLNSHGPETVCIFDMPPVLACDDVLAFTPYADAILMIVAEGKAKRTSVSRTMEMMADRNLLGVVLNRSREKDSVSPYY